MFNEERKLKFIDEICTTKASATFATAMFNSINKYEVAYNRDSCEFSSQELDVVIPNIVSNNAIHKINTIAMLRKYNTWCKENNITVDDCIFSVSPEQFKNNKASDKMYYNPEHLKMALDCLFPTVNEGTVNNVKRAFYWLIFSGVDKDDALNLTAREVDLSKMEVRPRGKKNVSYDICKEAIEDLRVACTAEAFLYIHNEPYYETYKPRIDGDKILRTFSDKIRISVFKPKAEVSIFDLDFQLDFKSVGLSGDFYRMYMRELAGIKPNFGSLIARDIQKMKKDHTDEQEKILFSSLKYKYKVNYQQWKDNMIR